MNISASYYSAKGGREKNEDAVSLLESRDNVLAIVADGLGGHAGGEIASKLAVQTITSQIAHVPLTAPVLEKAIQSANEAVEQKDANHGMRTTVATLWFDKDHAFAATVGDTRIYQFRDNGIVFQSRDHSLSQMAVMMGEITPDMIRGHKDRNRLIRALGAQDEVKVDMIQLNVLPGDAFLLCSDGFWENVLEKDMQNDLQENDSAASWLNKMKDKVEERRKPSGDNHSAIAVIIGSEV